MIWSRVEQKPPADATKPSDSSDSRAHTIEAWLDLLERFLRLPERERAAIRAELESHLRERVRDLELSGRDETHAIQTALREVGDAAELARRYATARQTVLRRRIMNITLCGLTAAVAATGALVFTGAWPGAEDSASVAPSINASVFTPAMPVDEALEHEITLESPIMLESLFEHIETETGLTVRVYWDDLIFFDIYPEREMTLGRAPMTVATALNRLRSESEEWTAAWRVTDNLLEIGNQDRFDRRERVLVSYNVGEILNRLIHMHSQQPLKMTGPTTFAYTDPRREAVGSVTNLITTFVEPNAWRERGGDIATLEIVGGRMFVEAPPRMHEQIEWILAQFETEVKDEPKALRAPPPPAGGAAPPVPSAPPTPGAGAGRPGGGGGAVGGPAGAALGGIGRPGGGSAGGFGAPGGSPPASTERNGDR